MMRSYLGRAAGRTPTNDDELQAMRKAAWHKQGVVMVKPEEIRNEWARQALINHANELYGERKR